MLEKLGFKRVILSRETKLEDIKLIKQKTNLEIEFFVHGALCVAFSGNCYFSQILHGKSGNRGECLQLCRLPYKYNDNEKISHGYLLSATDLCLIKNLKILIEAGVTSFKIEGRLRRPSYVATVVKSYQDAIKNLDVFTEDDYQKEIKKMSKVFNRGNFNENAYLQSNVPNNIVNPLFNNHVGVPIGKVLECKPFKNINTLIIESNKTLHENDGLKFFKENKEIASLGIGNVDELGNGLYKIYTKYNIEKNSQVNLILDSSYENSILLNIKKLKINAQVCAKLNENLKVQLSYEGLKLSYTDDYVCQKAKSCLTSKEEIYNQINKTNDTNFEFKSLEIDSDGFIFIPKSIINQARRSALENFENYIINNNETKNVKINEVKLKTFLNEKPIENELKKDVYIVDNINKAYHLTNCIIAFSPQIWSKQIFTEFETEITNLNNDCLLAINLPVIANYLDILLINECLNALTNKPILLSNNLWSLHYAYKGFLVIASYNHNIYNLHTILTLKTLGINNFCATIEKNLQYQNIYAYNGYSTLMNFCHCPYKTCYNSTCTLCKSNDKLILSNEYNQDFPIRKLKLNQCYFELISNKKLINNSSFKIIDIR